MKVFHVSWNEPVIMKSSEKKISQCILPFSKWEKKICCYFKWSQIKHMLVFDSEINVQKKTLNKIVGHKNVSSLQVTVLKFGNSSIHFFNVRCCLGRSCNRPFFQRFWVKFAKTVTFIHPLKGSFSYYKRAIVDIYSFKEILVRINQSFHL